MDSKRTKRTRVAVETKTKKTSGDSVEIGQALRDDTEKFPWALVFKLLPWDAMKSIFAVYRFGITKAGANGRGYPPHNWEKGMRYSRIVGSMMRHLEAFMKGELLDSQSKLPHLAHLAWNAIALLTYHLRGMDKKLNDLEFNEPQ